MITLSRRDNCRLCGSKSAELVLQLTPTPPGDMYLPPEYADKAAARFPLDLYLCRDCGYVHLRDIIEPDAIYRDYIYTTASSPGLIKHFERYAQHVAGRLQLPQSALAVDIGSNDGALLRCLRKAGLRVMGVEPAIEIAAKASREGVPTLCRYFDAEAARAIRAEHGAAHLVTANNVFANIDDLSGVVDNVKIVLAPGGVFVVEFAYLGDLIRNRIFDYIYHEHLSYFSVEVLRRFFESKAMKMVGVEHVETKGGSVRSYVQRMDDIHALNDSLDPWVAAEDRAGLRDPATYRALQRTVEAARSACRNILGTYKAQNRRIIGYGASVTCTTLIYHFGLADYLDYLVDDNRSKIGTLCPGLGLDVRPSAEIYGQGPAVVVVLAWRFVEMIVTRNQPFLAQGGMFIAPMPELRVIEGRDPNN